MSLESPVKSLTSFKIFGLKLSYGEMSPAVNTQGAGGSGGLGGVGCRGSVHVLGTMGGGGWGGWAGCLLLPDASAALAKGMYPLL